MRYAIAIMLCSSLLLAGCGDALTSRAVDERCGPREEWCPSLGSCLDPWESYCPEEGEHVKLMTVNDCDAEGGGVIDYGGGERCSDEQEVIGEVAGFLSLHVCCYPRPEGWEGY
ncbi:hypothetical protein JXA12_00450 [Candidatus Woesearchaeota archaeon]|nr:hypothetical protein [Candidatus Woesearchaeota archaeon]